MKHLQILCVGTMFLISSGCATKSYVSKSIDPVNGKLDGQGQKLDQTAASLQKTQQQLDTDETTLSATKETASSADARAGDALSRADAANNKATDAAARASDASSKAEQASLHADQIGHDLNGQIANLEDYKKVSTATVNFKLNSDLLAADAMQQLDEVAAAGNKYKRYVITVEGFTDQTGSAAYNMALSRRRADAAVAYLVSKHDIPVYRIQMIGLGKDKLVDEGKNRLARAKNRRVEISVYSADQSSGPLARN